MPHLGEPAFSALSAPLLEQQRKTADRASAEYVAKSSGTSPTLLDVDITLVMTAPEFRYVCLHAGRYVLDGAGEAGMSTAVIALAEVARVRHWRVETVIKAFHRTPWYPGENTAADVSRRYARVLDRLLMSYFAELALQPSLAR